jgi:hypothetical protein
VELKTAKNSGKTGKVMPKGKPFVKGQSGNPNGAPRKGFSWKEILDDIGGLDGKQALERAGRIFNELRKYPEGVTLKELAAISYFIRMINDPSGSLLNVAADRMDGKVTEQIDVTSGGDKVANINEVYASVIHKLGLVEQPAEDSTDKEPKPE